MQKSTRGGQTLRRTLKLLQETNIRDLCSPDSQLGPSGREKLYFDRTKSRQHDLNLAIFLEISPFFALRF